MTSNCSSGLLCLLQRCWPLDEVLVCQCCMNNAHRTCTLSGEAAAWSCSSCDWTDGSDQSEEAAVTSNQGEINLNREGKMVD